MSSDDSLEAADQALRQAQEALRAARRHLTQAVLSAYANGESVARIAERTHRTTTEVWNTLAVHGITRGNAHLNGTGPHQPTA